MLTSLGALSCLALRRIIGIEECARTIRKESLEIRHKLSQHHVYLSHVEEHTAGRKTVASVSALGALYKKRIGELF